MATDAATASPGEVAGRTRAAGPFEVPALGSVMREAASDVYFNSWRLGPANVIWGLMLVGLVVLAAVWPPALVFVPILGIPGIGLARMAVLAVREGTLGFSDFRTGIARWWRRGLGVAALGAALAIVLTTNAVAGLGSPDPIGWLIGILALYGDIGLAMILVTAWPLLVDPEHAGRSALDCLRLAGLIALWRPARVAGLTLALAVILVASTILFAVLLTVGVAYANLVAARVVLPLADALEARFPAVSRA
jgi:hypothetical protein